MITKIEIRFVSDGDRVVESHEVKPPEHAQSIVMAFRDPRGYFVKGNDVTIPFPAPRLIKREGWFKKDWLCDSHENDPDWIKVEWEEEE